MTGYGICGGIHTTLVWMICGQYDILYASLKNLGKAESKIKRKMKGKIHNSNKLNNLELFKYFFKLKLLNFLMKFWIKRQNLSNKEIQKENSSDFKFEEVDEYFLSTEKDDLEDEMVTTLNDFLIDCVKHHQMILESTKLLEDYFRWLMFPKLFYTGKKLSVHVKQQLVDFLEKSLHRFYKLLSYFPSICQAFLVCILAYVLSTMEENSIIKMENIFIYLSLSCSDSFLFNFNAEILKQHVKFYKMLC